MTFLADDIAVGDRVSVSFPLEPVVPFAGCTVSAHVRALNASDDYPYRVEWTTHDEPPRTLSRMIRASWIIAVSSPARMLDSSPEARARRRDRVQRYLFRSTP